VPRGRPRIEKIEEAEPTWHKNAKASKDVWARNTADPKAFDNYVKSIAKILGMSETEVRVSLPASNWKDFQGKTEVKKTNFEAGIEEAFKEKRWSTNYKTAYTKRVA
jgi:hypothetical protein